MIKIAVCDDEKKDREKVCELIQEQGRHYSIEYELRLFESGEQFLESGFLPDILFLDIIMDKRDGIDIGNQLKMLQMETMIVYITNLSEKISAALNRVHAYGYLVKPVRKKDLFQIMSDAVRKISQNKKSQYETFLSEKNTIIKLLVQDIYYFEYCSRKIKIVARDNTYLCVTEKINAIAERMKPYGFAMCHQSFVVNLYQVELIEGQMLLLKNGEKIYLAQKRASGIRKQLMQIARNTMKDGGSKSNLTYEE